MNKKYISVWHPILKRRIEVDASLLFSKNISNKVESEKLSNLLENPYNRELDRSKIDKIKEDIESSGKILPLVYAEVDNDGKKSKMITDGHHRFIALQELGYDEVPVVMQDSRGTDTKAPKTDLGN